METNIKYKNFDNEDSNIAVEATSSNNNNKQKTESSDKNISQQVSSSSVLKKCLENIQQRPVSLAACILFVATVTLLASLILVVSLSHDVTVTKTTTMTKVNEEIKKQTNTLLSVLTQSDTLKLCAKGFNCTTKGRSAPNKQFRCFIYNNTALSWNSARQYCRSIGGFLAEVHDYATLDFMRGYLKNREVPVADVWLGGTDNTTENLWLWETTRTPFNDVWNWADNSCILPSFDIMR